MSDDAARVAAVSGHASEWFKRPMDLAVLAASHILLLPLWLALWLVIPVLIVLDTGRPVFYRQRRIGRDGQLFNALKFRTMVKDADKIGPAWTDADDPRLTRVGRVLRGTALDELPQLINILKGDMCFVGPRALAEDEYRALSQEIEGFNARLRLRPGLTGVAQVYGNRDDAREKLRYDLAYAASLSPWLDAKLIFLSIWITVRGTWERRDSKL